MNRPTDPVEDAAMTAYHGIKHRLTMKDVQVHEIFIEGFKAGHKWKPGTVTLDPNNPTLFA